jgi:pimeloyl-ACP methyl ester carboxylesterase
LAADQARLSPCDQSDVSKFPIQLESSQKSFQYHYRLIKAADPTAPLVIYIPGGPGDTSIGTEDPRISKDYSLVLTDPRGAGCNDSPDITSSDITSEQIAKDVIQLVHQLNPRHYIVHGFSFGTVVATIFSSLIANQAVVPPESIILEGVFGHYQEEPNENGIFAAWDQIRSRLSPSTRAALLSSEQNPFGLTLDEWFGAVYNLIYFGQVSWLPYSLDQLLNIFVDYENGIPLPFGINSLWADLSDGSLPFSVKTNTAIVCNELFFDPSIEIGKLSYAFGVFQSAGSNPCKATHPSHYDSKLWQVHERTLYIMGANDPATPLTQGLYHFDNQQNKDNVAIIVSDAGHPALSIGLRDCMHDIYENAWTGGSISPALKKCAAETTLIDQQSHHGFGASK